MIPTTPPGLDRTCAQCCNFKRFLKIKELYSVAPKPTSAADAHRAKEKRR